MKDILTVHGALSNTRALNECAEIIMKLIFHWFS